jgi:hypothetical protein
MKLRNEKKKRKWWIKKKREELIAKGCDDKKANALAVDAYWEKQKAELPPKKRKRIEFSERSMQDPRAWPNTEKDRRPRDSVNTDDRDTRLRREATKIALKRDISHEKAMGLAKEELKRRKDVAAERARIKTANKLKNPMSTLNTVSKKGKRSIEKGLKQTQAVTSTKRRRKKVTHASIAKQRGVVSRVRQRLLRALREINNYEISATQHMERRNLKSVFNPAVEVVFKRYNLSPVAFSLLFFIEECFGLRFEKKQEGSSGSFYWVGSGNWDKWAKRHICREPKFSRVKSACKAWEVKDVPASYLEEIQGNLSGHSFIDKIGATHSPRGESESEVEKDSFVVLPWTLLPPDHNSFGGLMSYYKSIEKEFYSKHRQRVDEARLRAILSLKPDRKYRCSDGFLGYLVLEFERYEKVILECPVYGNAVYLLYKNSWKSRARESKKYIRENYPGSYRRVLHTDGWLQKVRMELRNSVF